jgi:hypothetical protein
MNAVLHSGRITTTIDAADADGDLAGAFVSALFRDDALDRTDGQPDVGVYNIDGYLPPFQVPDRIVAGRPFNAADVLGIIVDLIDRAGHVTRIVDAVLTK